MATIRPRKNAQGETRYRAEVRIKRKGKIVFRDSRTFAKKKLAETWSKKRELELEDDAVLRRAIRSKGAKVTFGELIDMYIAIVKPLNPWQRTKDYSLAMVKSRPIADIDCQDLQAVDIVTHCLDRMEKDGVKPQTVTQDWIYISEVIKCAGPVLGVPVDINIANEAQQVLKKFNVLRRSSERERRPTEVEITDIVRLAHERRLSPRHQNNDFAMLDRLIVFQMFSSRRIAETCRIEWADLNEDRQTIVVRDMKHPGQKIGNDVEVYIPYEAFQVIRVMPKHPSEPRIFPYNERSMKTLFARLRDAAGHYIGQEESLRLHDLRHECISWLFEKNGYNGEAWDIPKVAKVSGHRSWSSLKRYEDIIEMEPRDRWKDWEWKEIVLN